MHKNNEAWSGWGIRKHFLEKTTSHPGPERGKEAGDPGSGRAGGRYWRWDQSLAASVKEHRGVLHFAGECVLCQVMTTKEKTPGEFPASVLHLGVQQSHTGAPG